MKKQAWVVVWLCLTSSIFGLGTKALGATAADYYNAGLQLYNAQNYPQAIQYFNAAVSLDPNNAAALQGRANCYYAQGQYQQALADYQKVQAIQPNPQLASMIQALKAKVGTTAPAAAGAATAPAAASAPTANSFSQGIALFQQQQYTPAIPLFQKAVQENPSDSTAYYYLGAAQMQAGDMKDAAVALGISNKLKPNPSVGNYVGQLKARLAPEDQQWVDAQIAAGPAGQSQPAVSHPPKKFGIRLQPSILLLSLADFNTNAQSVTNEVTLAQSIDPTISYSGSVPSGAARIGFEPVYRVSPNFEIGIPLAVIPVGTVSDNTHDNNGLTVTDSYDITAISAGLNLRYLLGSGDFQPFISAGAMIVPINIAYSAGVTIPTLINAYSASGTFTGTAAGGQISLGLDWHLGDTFVISPFAGYQFASGNSFQATNSSNSAVGAGQTTELEVIPTSAGNVITPVSNGQLLLPVPNGNQPPLLPGSNVPAGSKPLEIDLGGPIAGIQISVFF